MPLSGRVAVVTGATGGVGRVVCRELAAEGARLGLVGTNADRLAVLAAELDLPADRWAGQEADLRSADAARSAVDAIVGRFQSADILVHLIQAAPGALQAAGASGVGASGAGAPSLR